MLRLRPTVISVTMPEVREVENRRRFQKYLALENVSSRTSRSPPEVELPVLPELPTVRTGSHPPSPIPSPPRPSASPADSLIVPSPCGTSERMPANGSSSRQPVEDGGDDATFLPSELLNRDYLRRQASNEPGSSQIRQGQVSGTRRVSVELAHSHPSSRSTIASSGLSSSFDLADFVVLPLPHHRPTPREDILATPAVSIHDIHDGGYDAEPPSRSGQPLVPSLAAELVARLHTMPQLSRPLPSSEEVQGEIHNASPASSQLPGTPARRPPAGVAMEPDSPAQPVRSVIRAGSSRRMMPGSRGDLRSNSRSAESIIHSSPGPALSPPPVPRTPGTFRVYDDSLPASSQPQTPQNLPEARHQSRLRGSYTVPVRHTSASSARTPTAGQHRYRTRRTRNLSPPGLQTPGFMGLYGGIENTDESVLFEQASREGEPGGSLFRDPASP